VTLPEVLREIHVHDARPEVAAATASRHAEHLRARLALIEARLQAVERREEIVELIGGSANPRQAERRLRELLDLSSEQAHFVLELPWGELTKAAVERMRQERDDLRAMLESEQP
jgi:DNA gyrase/topoisomerase IV subunit A